MKTRKHENVHIHASIAPEPSKLTDCVCTRGADLRVQCSNWLYLSRLAALKEFAFMRALQENDFSVPRAVECNRHAVLMSMVQAIPLTQVCERRERPQPNLPTSLHRTNLRPYTTLSSFCVAGPPYANNSKGAHTSPETYHLLSTLCPSPQCHACSWESCVFTTLVTSACWTCVPLMYCTTHLEDASGILHFIVSVLRLTGLYT
eukprot:1190892-Prorocentrum_minimum.AAC.2